MLLVIAMIVVASSALFGISSNSLTLYAHARWPSTSKEARAIQCHNSQRFAYEDTVSQVCDDGIARGHVSRGVR